MKNLLAVAVIATTCSVPASAEELQRFHAMLGVGAFRIDSAAYEDTAPSAVIGGRYNFSRQVGVEAGYSRLFNATDVVDDTRVTIDGNVWDLTARLSYPVTGRFEPYARLGWSYADLAARANDGDSTTRFNDYDDGLTWAAGGSVRVRPTLVLSSEYGRILLDDVDIDRLSFNIAYRFGSH